MTMTSYRQAEYAPEHGLGRQGLIYDRLRTEWQAAGRTVPGAVWHGALKNSSSDQRTHFGRRRRENGLCRPRLTSTADVPRRAGLQLS
jgi:hypothetical protein